MLKFDACGFPQIYSHLIQESPTLDLVNDCSCFVTRYFGIIDVSSPHIYHSALVLSPKTSTVRKLYGSYAKPFAQVVCGVPMSWDPYTAATSFSFSIGPVVWSPCNKFIAVGAHGAMQVYILDSATLQQLQVLKCPQQRITSQEILIFSPDIRMLTCLFKSSYATEAFIISWNLQTGGIVSVITPGKTYASEITYSKNGKMVAVFTWSNPRSYQSSISIYDVVSGVYIHGVHLDTPHVCAIWAYGEFIQFATVQLDTIIIHQVECSPEATCTEVITLSIPGITIYHVNYGGKTQFLSTSYQLAIQTPDCGVLMWSVEASKYMLHNIYVDTSYPATFSSDGHLFTCTSCDGKVQLWGETSAGYILHAQLPVTQNSRSLLSPDGKLVITFFHSAIQLWNVKHFTAAPSSIPTKVLPDTHEFIVDFLPDRQLAVVTRQMDKTVMVLNLNSGLLQSTIETSMEVYGLRAIGDTVVVIGDCKAITWNLAGDSFFLDSKMGVKNSVQTVEFRNHYSGNIISTSISPNLCYIATLKKDFSTTLVLSKVSTWEDPTSQDIKKGRHPLWFTSDGLNVCCSLGEEGVGVVKIPQYGPQNEPVGDIWRCPWESSSGYQVTDDGWILGTDEKRLLMLPTSWQSHVEKMVWNGQFLALLHNSLPELVILKLEP